MFNVDVAFFAPPSVSTAIVVYNAKHQSFGTIWYAERLKVGREYLRVAFWTAGAVIDVAILGQQVHDVYTCNMRDSPVNSVTSWQLLEC